MPDSRPATTSQPETATIRVSRVIKAPPERIFDAFLDPDAMAKWLPPHGFTGRVHEMDARVGGRYRMSFSTLNRSWTQAFGGEFLELDRPNRLVYTDAFETDDPAMEGEIRATITFTPVEGGTRVDVVQEGVPKPAAEGAPEGWSQSLDNLQNLVEAELPF